MYGLQTLIDQIRKINELKTLYELVIGKVGQKLILQSAA